MVTSLPGYVTNSLVASLTSLAIVLTIWSSSIAGGESVAQHLQDPRPANNQRHEPDVIAIKEGADLDLKCPIEAPNEDMIISWTCENEPANIRSSRIHVTDSGTLRIHSAKVGDSCNYRCEAADGFGTLSVTIRVIIVDKSLIEQLSRKNNTSMKGKIIPVVDPLPRFVPSESHWSAPLSPAANNEDNLQQQLRATQATDLDIQVEPAAIRVDRNKSFTLECRVWHAPESPPPQMIWLKEFIGRKPETLSEAHEQNLVLIDNVYYHSLNWPRSVSYSKKAASANSALLIRQSSYVHSGRYICFAGYPPAIMSSNLTLSSSLATTATSATGGSSSSPLLPVISVMGKQTRSLPKYKMAFVSVSVDDLEGETNHRLMLESSGGGQFSRAAGLGEQSKGLLIDVLSTSTWMRNLTILSILVCCLICVARLVVANRQRRFGQLGVLVDAKRQSIIIRPQLSPQNDPSNEIDDDLPSSLAIKQLNNLPVNNKHQLTNHASLLLTGEDCLQSFGIESHHDDDEDDDGQGANNFGSHQADDYAENPYSEIGDRRPASVNLTSIATGEPIYKVPNNQNINAGRG